MNRDGHLASLMNRAMFLLDNSVEDVRLGRYSTRERRHLADGLAALVHALRDEDRPVVIEGNHDA